MKTKFDREYVYKLIDGERDYQESKWSPDYDDSKWAINDWIVFIERYIAEAKNTTGHRAFQMDAMRKIGALAVAAMEHYETLPRG